MRKTLFSLLFLLLPVVALGQTAYPPTADLSGTTARKVTVVSSLPAGCIPGSGEIIALVSGGVTSIYECQSANTWKKLTTTTGSFATNDCVKFDSAGNLVSNGSACGAGGGGTVSGTAGKIAKFTSGSAVGDSVMTEASTVITTAGTHVINGATLTTAADGTVAGLTVNGIINPPGSNTTAVTYPILQIKPTFNSNIGVNNKTIDLLQVDTVNTDTTGLAVNLLNLKYAGSALFTISSIGSLTTGIIPVARLAGSVPVANGGTGLSAGLSGGVPYFSSTGTMASSPTLLSASLIFGSGTGAPPGTVLGISSDATSKIILGDGTNVGGLVLKNTTSGTVTIQPVTGALGSAVLSLPARTSTIATTTGTTTTNNCAKWDASGNVVDAGATCGGGGGTLTVGSSAISSGTALRMLFENASNVLGETAGITTDGTSKFVLGVAGTSVGSIDFKNATSGTINLAPATGALGTSNLVLPIASDTLVAKATTDTFTNKTYDAEATGNVLTVPTKIALPAAGCNNVTPGTFWDLPTTNAGTPFCVTGTNIQKGVLQFADSANQSAQTTLNLPDDWSGAIDIKLLFTSADTTSGHTEKFTVATACTTPSSGSGTTDDPSFNTAQTLTYTLGASEVGSALRKVSQAGLTATGCSAGSVLHLKVGRDVTDTDTGTINFVGAELTIRRAM